MTVFPQPGIRRVTHLGQEPLRATSSAASGSPPVKGAVLREHLAGHRQGVHRGRPRHRRGHRGGARRRARRRATLGPHVGRPSAPTSCNKIADRIEQNLEVLAVAETWDNGKPVRETLAADLPLAVDHFRYFAGVLRAQEGAHLARSTRTPSPTTSTSRSASSAQIIPWNFPILMAVVEARPGARRRQLRRAQAGRADARGRSSS